MDRIKLDYTHTIGNSNDATHLLSTDDIEQIKNDIISAHNQVKAERTTAEELSFLSLPTAYSREYGETIFKDVLIDARSIIEETASRIKSQFTDYVQIAIGGSALGAIALHNALGVTEKGGVRIHLPDNIDPEIIAEIMNSMDAAKTFVSVVSKSGGTVETLSNFFVFYNELQKKIPKEKIKEHVAIMTNPEKGPLAELCQQEGFTLIPIPNSVHGRFSVLSPGGLLTAAVSGIDIDELLKGAYDIDQETESLSFWDNPVLLYSAIHYLLNTKKGLDTIILIPYSNKLGMISDWFSQLVAESLGKENKGLTPIKALGVIDQHSQLQLYNEGPKNKFVMFFNVEKFREQVQIPTVFPTCSDYQYLWGNTLNDLIDSEQKATGISLYKHQVPSLSLQMPEISPYYMGQLLMLLEKVIPILGKLYHVNAFNQPGVEESKEYARALMGKKGQGYESKRREIESLKDPAKRKRA